MANSGARRLGAPDQQPIAKCFSVKQTGLLGSPTSSSSSSTLPINPNSASQAAIHHHQLHQQQLHHHTSQLGGATGKTDTGAHYRGHQRRQSVARLLPDISKLRLLSWLVEASSELINCDIAIMDGVYAKLNRSRESLLFWNSNTTGQHHLFGSVGQQQPVATTAANQQQQQQPAPPSVQPVANKIVISQRNKLRQKQLQQRLRQNKANNQARDHHSLPLTNYDASSLAAVSLSASLGPHPSNRSRRVTAADTSSLSLVMMGSSSSAATGGRQLEATNEQVPGEANGQNEDFSDSDQSDDDDNSSASGSSTSSSGIHGGGTSLSSGTSSASSSCLANDLGAASQSADHTNQQEQQQTPIKQTHVSSAEQLSEKIRRTVMEHNYLQSLLVNIIRQHDRQRDLLNRQRRRLIAVDQFNVQQQQRIQQQQRRIDLTEIADALDDGCLCSCHSQRDRCQITPVIECSLDAADTNSLKSGRSSTLPANCNNQQQVAPARKARRLKKLRGNNAANSNNPSGLNREDIIQLLADKLCENCFETHYWLHGCSIDLLQPKTRQESSSSSSPAAAAAAATSQQDINGIVTKRNATFIKLVQQEVRSTISKSIELIDLIRKEIKLPESIKQKQLMRCFSTSIQLLTSVGNYVVPAQDISTFIPEVGQEQTTLFCLPSSDFDHLLLYPSSMNNNNNNPANHHHQPQQLNYHLASAPDIPIRRRANQYSLLSPSGLSDNNSGSLPIPNRGGGIKPTTSSGQQVAHINNSAEHALSSNLQRLKTSDNPVPGDSSSGNSSNNSSASSSIARGTVQQSSLTRAQTSSAILDGKTSHDLSFETIANLSRQQTEDDMMFQSRPRFWQSSKFNFIKKLLHVKQQRLLRQQSKDRRIYNNKVQNKFRLVMMDLTHFNKSQQLLTTENGVNSLLTSMRNVLEFGLYLTLKLC